jgi:hypothetical protein
MSEPPFRDDERAFQIGAQAHEPTDAECAFIVKYLAAKDRMNIDRLHASHDALLAAAKVVVNRYEDGSNSAVLGRLRDAIAKAEELAQ